MTAGLVLVAILLLAGTSDRTGLVGVFLLSAMCVVWLLINEPMEGNILVTVTNSHGLTEADLVSFAGFGLAGWRLVQWRRSRAR